MDATDATRIFEGLYDEITLFVGVVTDTMGEATGPPTDVERFEVISSCTNPDLTLQVEPLFELATPVFEMTTVMPMSFWRLEFPEPHMVPGAWALLCIGRNLKCNVVRAVKEVEGAHRCGRVGAIEKERHAFAKAVTQACRFGFMQASRLHGQLQVFAVSHDDGDIDRV